MPSFDLVSKFDMGELKNALNMAEKLIASRYDFKGSKCAFEFKDEKELELRAEDDYKMKAALEILYGAMTKRNLGLRGLEAKDIEPTGNRMLKQTIIIRSGIDKEHAKTINKLIKDSNFKVSSQYMDEKIRVTSKKIDDLQGIFHYLRTHKEVDIDLAMENMKS